MSKSNLDSYQCVVSVLGYVSHGKVYKSSLEGSGKSCLCCRLTHPAVDDYIDDHPSLLALHEFESKVVCTDSFLYWGTKELEFSNSPKGKTSKVKVEVVEHTLFYHDETSKVFPRQQALHNPDKYTKQALVSPDSSRKISYYSRDCIGFPDRYRCVPYPSNVNRLPRGFIIACDVSVKSPKFEAHLATTEQIAHRLFKDSKLPFIVAATKRDSADSYSLQKLYEWASKKKIPVIETSAKENINVRPAFMYIVSKIFKSAKLGCTITSYADAVGTSLLETGTIRQHFKSFLAKRVRTSNFMLSSIEDSPEYIETVNILGKFGADEMYALHLLSIRDTEIRGYQGVLENPDMRMEMLEQFVEDISLELAAHKRTLKSLINVIVSPDDVYKNGGMSSSTSSPRLSTKNHHQPQPHPQPLHVETSTNDLYEIIDDLPMINTQTATATAVAVPVDEVIDEYDSFDNVHGTQYTKSTSSSPMIGRVQPSPKPGAGSTPKLKKENLLMKPMIPSPLSSPKGISKNTSNTSSSSFMDQLQKNLEEGKKNLEKLEKFEVPVLDNAQRSSTPSPSPIIKPKIEKGTSGEGSDQYGTIHLQQKQPVATEGDKTSNDRHHNVKTSSSDISPSATRSDSSPPLPLKPLTSKTKPELSRNSTSNSQLIPQAKKQSSDQPMDHDGPPPPYTDILSNRLSSPSLDPPTLKPKPLSKPPPKPKHKPRGTSPVPLPLKEGPIPLPQKEAGPIPLPQKGAGPIPPSQKEAGPIPFPQKEAGPIPLPQKEAGPIPLPQKGAGPVPPSQKPPIQRKPQKDTSPDKSVSENKPVIDEDDIYISSSNDVEETAVKSTAVQPVSSVAPPPSGVQSESLQPKGVPIDAHQPVDDDNIYISSSIDIEDVTTPIKSITLPIVVATPGNIKTPPTVMAKSSKAITSSTSNKTVAPPTMRDPIKLPSVEGASSYASPVVIDKDKKPSDSVTPNSDYKPRLDAIRRKLAEGKPQSVPPPSYPAPLLPSSVEGSPRGSPRPSPASSLSNFPLDPTLSLPHSRSMEINNVTPGGRGPDTRGTSSGSHSPYNSRTLPHSRKQIQPINPPTQDTPLLSQDTSNGPPPLPPRTPDMQEYALDDQVTDNQSRRMRSKTTIGPTPLNVPSKPDGSLSPRRQRSSTNRKNYFDMVKRVFVSKSDRVQEDHKLPEGPERIKVRKPQFVNMQRRPLPVPPEECLEDIFANVPEEPTLDYEPVDGWPGQTNRPPISLPDPTPSLPSPRTTLPVPSNLLPTDTEELFKDPQKMEDFIRQLLHQLNNTNSQNSDPVISPPVRKLPERSHTFNHPSPNIIQPRDDTTGDDGYEVTDEWGVPPIAPPRGGEIEYHYPEIRGYKSKQRGGSPQIFPSRSHSVSPKKGFKARAPTPPSEDDYLNMDQTDDDGFDYENADAIRTMRKGRSLDDSVLRESSSVLQDRRRSMADNYYYNIHSKDRYIKSDVFSEKFADFNQLTTGGVDNETGQTQSEGGEPNTIPIKKRKPRPLPPRNLPRVNSATTTNAGTDKTNL